MKKYTLLIVAAICTSNIPVGALSDTLGPPRFAANRGEFEIAKSVCKLSIAYSKEDVTIGVSKTRFAYIDKSQCASADGDKYCLTLIVDYKNDGVCHMTFFSDGNPSIESGPKGMNGKYFEIITFKTNMGKVEITTDH